jgi:4-diphosphocytidyl-2-C-methyl-D-erythritol kinase
MKSGKNQRVYYFGGGSADAAFALRMLNQLFSIQLETMQLEKYAAQIGADCTFFIHNKPVFAEGIGNQFSPLNIDLSNYKIVILKPETGVSTPEAYRNIVPAKPTFDLKKLHQTKVDDWKSVVKNDFEKSVFPQYPEIEKLKNILYKTGAFYASMSGSGSAVFGIFRHLPANFDKFIPKGVFIYL